jgi:hypothetical protein
LGDIDFDEKIILKCIIKKQDGSVWAGFSWLSFLNIGRLL